MNIENFIDEHNTNHNIPGADWSLRDAKTKILGKSWKYRIEANHLNYLVGVGEIDTDKHTIKFRFVFNRLEKKGKVAKIHAVKNNQLSLI